jgi:hypothetical protein
MEADCDTTVLSVLETVAAAERVDPVDLPPLSETLDPAALNALLDHEAGGQTPVTLTFEYCGYEVTANGPDAVTAEPVAFPATSASPTAASETDASEERVAD